MREQLLKKQKELLELQQKKLELELLQTKAKLEEQQKQLERQTVNVQPEQTQVNLIMKNCEFTFNKRVIFICSHYLNSLMNGWPVVTYNSLNC